MKKNARNKINKSKVEDGFTLLFSLLIISIVLSVSLGVADLIIRELTLSSIGKESQKAFYAADTGIECAMFWDVQKDHFDKLGDYKLDCAGKKDIDNDVGKGVIFFGGSTTTSFTLDFGDSCAKVDLIKTEITGVGKITTIDSLGYNMACSVNSVRQVERGLRIGYRDK